MPTKSRSSNTENAPCPFCGGSVDPEGWLNGTGQRGPECEGCGATAPSLVLWNAARPAQQHHGEPVMRLECEKLWGGDGEYAVDFIKPGWLQECREKGGTFLLYTHADPAEVERLCAVIDQQKNLIESLRADLVESHSIDASAEPSAPVDCKASRLTG